MTHSVLHSFTQSVTLYALWNVHETHFVAYSVTNFMKRFVTHSLTFSVTPLTFTQTVFWPLFFAANIKNDAIKKRLKKKDLYYFLILQKNDLLRDAFVPHSRNAWHVMHPKTHFGTHFLMHLVMHLMKHSVTHSVTFYVTYSIRITEENKCCRDFSKDGYSTVFMKTQFWFVNHMK